MTRSSWLILCSVVVFVVAAVLVAVDDSVGPTLVSVLLFGGLAAFAAGHLPG